MTPRVQLKFMRLIALCLLLVPSLMLAVEPVSFRVGEFDFTRPQEWKSTTPSSAMRKAHLIATAEDGSTADIIFFHFGPGQGGSVKANADRWLRQFQDPQGSKVDSQQVGETKITTVVTKGTFLSGMPGTPSTPLQGFALRGAILESPQGDVYVKMTGPEKVVQQASQAFDGMVEQAAK